MISTPTPPPEVRIEIRSNPLYLSGAREMVAAVARRMGYTEEACGQIALAVDEALCNVIRHGYDRASDKPIWISLWPLGETTNGAADSGAGGGGSGGSNGLSEAAGAVCCRQTPDVHVAGLRIVIDDEAKQVDPSVIKSRDLDEVRPGGLGVHIIKAVMDEVKYERRSPIGMRLSMVKKRVGSQSDSSSASNLKGTGCSVQCVNPGGVNAGCGGASKGGGQHG